MTASMPPVGKIRAFIFDLGGVILRTEDATPRTTLARRFGKTRAEIEEIIFNNPVSLKAEEGLASVDDVWENIRQILGIPPEEVRGVRRAFFGGDRVDFALVDLIRSLRPAYRTALLSNSWLKDMPRFLVEDLQIPPDTFDVVLSSASQGVAKPNPVSFLRALEKVGVEPAEAVFVDDNVGNIAGARAVGLHTVHFRSAGQARDELLAYLNPDYKDRTLPGGER